MPGRAADKADPETIEKLVKQLSSGRFAEREKAQKKLEEIGLPALPALKKALNDPDAVVRSVAADAIRQIAAQ